MSGFSVNNNSTNFFLRRGAGITPKKKPDEVKDSGGVKESNQTSTGSNQASTNFFNTKSEKISNNELWDKYYENVNFSYLNESSDDSVDEDTNTDLATNSTENAVIPESENNEEVTMQSSQPQVAPQRNNIFAQNAQIEQNIEAGENSVGREVVSKNTTSGETNTGLTLDSANTVLKSESQDSNKTVTQNSQSKPQIQIRAQTGTQAKPQSQPKVVSEQSATVKQNTEAKENSTEAQSDSTSSNAENVRDSSLYRTADSIDNFASAQGYIDDAMNYVTKTPGASAVGDTVGAVGMFVSGAKFGADTIDFVDNYDNRTGRENLHKATNVAEDAADGVTGVIAAVHPLAGAAANVVSKGAIRTISQTGEELHDIYKSDNDSITKIGKSVEAVGDIERKLVVNTGDVVLDTVGGLAKGAAGIMFDEKASAAVDGFVQDVKEFNRENINAVYGMKKNGVGIATNLVTGNTQEAKNLYKEAVGENYYNKTRDAYHSVKDTVNTVVDEGEKAVKAGAKTVMGEENYNAARETYHKVKKEVKETVKTAKSTVKKAVKETKKEVKETASNVVHSKPVQKAVKAVESLPGGKTLVEGAKKVYHWFGF